MIRWCASILLSVSLTACGGLADIRPDALKEADVTASVRNKGAARFTAMLEAHGGLDRWRSFDAVQTTFRDEWTNWLFFQITPYAENNQLASLRARLHAFPDGRIEFLEGRGAGETWTTRGELVIREKKGRTKQDPAWDSPFFAVFALNPEMMVGTPFRLASADQHAFVGTRTWRGNDYDVVLISWGDLAPQDRLDQWLLYLDPATDRLVGTEFTIRMSGKSSTGFYHYRDYAETDGLILAHTMDAYLDKEDKKPVHRYAFGDFAFHRDDAAAELP